MAADAGREPVDPLDSTAHRPWPLPGRRWSWRQSWHDLLFAHWPFPPERVRRHLPAGLDLDTFDGLAWVGVVPFRMTGVTRRPLPAIPGLSAFPELNVRTYVVRDGRPGVWFYSLDAANRLAVAAARRWFHLPYHYARMKVEAEGDGRVDYVSVRRRNPAGLSFVADYRPTGPVEPAARGSLDAWLTERYCLYAEARGGALTRTEVHHRPWPLQPASARIDRNDYLEPWELRPEGEPLLHFSRRIDVRVWSPESV